MDIQTGEKGPRELTHDERATIRKLVTGMCANYDSEYGCLPLDCPCYMLNKWWTGAYYKYFQNAVLPLNPVLQASLIGQNDDISPKICPVCGAPISRLQVRRIARQLAALPGSARQTAAANGTSVKCVTNLAEKSKYFSGFPASVLRLGA
jgi:hypothetical protein